MDPTINIRYMKNFKTALKSKLLFRLIILVTVAISFTTSVNSQMVNYPIEPLAEASNDNDVNPPIGDPDAEAPIDGGLAFLVVAGVGYGVKKVRDNRKKKVEAFS